MSQAGTSSAPKEQCRENHLCELLSNQSAFHLRRVQVAMSSQNKCESGSYTWKKSRWNLPLRYSTRGSRNLATGAGRRSQRCAKSYTTQILRSVGVRVVDVRLQPEPNVLVHGKGRRDRCIPLCKKPRGAPRLAIYQRGGPGSRTIYQCSRWMYDSCRIRVHPQEARPYGRKALRFSLIGASVAARPPAHLRDDNPPSHQRPAKGLALAWPFQRANDGDLRPR